MFVHHENLPSAMLLPYVGFVYENKVVMELVQKRYKLIDILFHYALNKQINLKTK